MTHAEARERLSLVQGVLEEVGENITDEILYKRMEDAAQSINDGIARLDVLTTGHGTDELKEPKPL